MVTSWWPYTLDGFVSVLINYKTALVLEPLYQLFAREVSGGDFQLTIINYPPYKSPDNLKSTRSSEVRLMSRET